MAKKKNTKPAPKHGKKSPFLGNLDHLGGKKLMQHGAEEGAGRGKESRKHQVGGAKRG